MLRALVRRIASCSNLSSRSSVVRASCLSTGAASENEHARLPEETAYSNVTPSIRAKVGRNLHLQRNHPIGIIKNAIVDYFQHDYRKSTLVPIKPDEPTFRLEDSLSPVTSTYRVFDSLLFPLDHPGRRKEDTYYLNETTVLRTHTTCHQTEFLSAGHLRYLAVGDVYRRDEIDATHYPVFHQLDAGRVFTPEETQGHDPVKLAEADMKQALEGLARKLFGQQQVQWLDDYFPFTHPSWQLEIMYNDKWLEVLGCGIIQRQILRDCKLEHCTGWAFGQGLERLAMILFSIPDIRLFWSNDERFTSQFEAGRIQSFVPYSTYPPCYKDITFWIPPAFNENDFSELVRETAGDIVESLKLLDSFVHPKTQRASRCYRINYRHMDRSLTNAEINELQEEVRRLAVAKLGVELR